MRKIMEVARRFRDDEDGAAMVEYAILLGMIAVAVVGVAIALGNWSSGQFAALCTAINATGVGVGCVP